MVIFILWDRDYVIQDKNIATYTLSSASVSLDDIPASGGSADSPNFVSASGKIDYSSGESDTPSITSSDVIITLSKTVNGSNLGSTIKARTKLDTVTATINWNGSKITQSIDVYQQANQVTYSSIDTTSATVNSPGSGKEIDIAALVNPKQTATYTSGATKDVDDFGYNFRNSPSWITIDEFTLKATVDKNVTGSTRDGEIRITLTGMGNRFTIESISVHQEALVMPSWDVPSTFRFDNNGQSDLSAAGLDLNISDPDNVGWIIEGPSYVTGTAVVSGSLPIRGTGDKSMSLAPNVNTSSERTFYLVLETSAGDAIATCSCTQEAKESVEDPSWELPATLAFEGGGGDAVAFSITDSNNVGWKLILPDWCFVSDGITEGSGDHDTDLAARANDTGSSRTGTVQLVSTDGNTVFAICQVTQEEDTTIEQG